MTHSAERTKAFMMNFALLKGSFATLERGGYSPFDGIPPISLRSKRCLWAVGSGWAVTQQPEHLGRLRKKFRDGKYALKR